MRKNAHYPSGGCVLPSRCDGKKAVWPWDYPMCIQVLLEESRFILVKNKAVGKFQSVIRLDALDGERERSAIANDRAVFETGRRDEFHVHLSNNILMLKIV